MQRTSVLARPSLAGKPRSVEVRDFDFDADNIEPYGFVTVGAKVCEVIPDSKADLLGVMPGWYIAAIDGKYLPGALIKFVRRVPVITTDEVRKLLHTKRMEALRREKGRSMDIPVKITFWTSPRPFNEEKVEDDDALTAASIDELKKILIKKYGDILTAWNEALDEDGSGVVSYKEFVTACRNIGFEGSLQEVFNQMDNDGSGEITIMELDASCTVNINKGRCKVCTLPNPCKIHGEEEQREAMRKEYVDIQAAAELERANAEGVFERFIGKRIRFFTVRFREFVRSIRGTTAAPRTRQSIMALEALEKGKHEMHEP